MSIELLEAKCPRCGKHSGVSYLKKCFSKPGQIYICSRCGTGLDLNWLAFIVILLCSVIVFWAIVILVQLSVVIAWLVSSTILLGLWILLPFKLPEVH